MIESTDRRPVRLAIVGLGWGARVAQAIASDPGIVLVSCFGRDRDARERFARQFGCASATTYEDLIADRYLEGVILMTPNHTHRSLAVAALESGRAVLVTKPMAATLDDCTAIIRAARASGCVLAVGHQSRRHPAIRKLRECVESGVLGRPVAIEGNTSSPTGASATSTWRSDPTACPGGPLLQLGIHYIDNFQYLLGPITRVMSWQQHDAGAAVPHTTTTLMRFGNGVAGTLISSYVSPSVRSLRLAGTEAVAVYNPATGLILERKEGTCESLVSPAPGEQILTALLREEIAEFAECIRRGMAPEVDGATGAQNVAVVLAAIESHRREMPIAVGGVLTAAGRSA